MAEREGFEPSVPLLGVHTISSHILNALLQLSIHILPAAFLEALIFLSWQNGFTTNYWNLPFRFKSFFNCR